MSIDSSMSVVFAGFRATGKTTFLVALWHTVLNNDVPGALSLETVYEGDRDYITKRYNEWLAYEKVKRTLVDHDTPIQMTLRDLQHGRLLQLGIPDLSGETFKVQFEERRASPTLIETIRGAAGIALFINPKKVKDATRIREAWSAVEEDEVAATVESQEPDGPNVTSDAPTAAGSQPLPVPDNAGSDAVEGASELPMTPPTGSGKRNPADEFVPSMCCTQVKYVDLLQQIIGHGAAKPVRCAVIVSAMDTLDGTEFENRPEHFIRLRMSLLYQFLKARSDQFHSRVYGVSAQGGHYDAASIDALAKLGAQRIRVCTDSTRDNDISRPVRWLAFGEE